MDDARAIPARGVIEDDDDDRLAAAAVADRRAFVAIYERYRPAVYRYLRARTASDDEAGELCAVTFEKALTGIAHFTPSRGGLPAWLVRIARNAHVDALRRSARHEAADRPDIGPAGSPISRLEEEVVLRSLVDALPEAQREAIRLRFAAGLTARQIGSVLGISEAAAQKHLERGLRALREAYGGD